VSGALAGLRVLELPAIGPVPFAATMLADHGASVLRITGNRPDLSVADPARATHLRGRPALPLDLRAEPERFLALAARADVVLEGFRPGALERLGLGPQALLAANPRLVVGRMTGWGQDGPLATTAGHDITYIAVAGALGSFARPGARPVPPLNLVGDYGGGAMMLLFGVLAALWESRRSGCGQVVDAAMVDGAAALMGLIWSFRGQGLWPGPAGTNLLDTGAPFYDTYVCADGGFVAVGCLEPQFYAAFLAGLGLDLADLPHQYDAAGWPVLRETFARVLGARPRSHWEAVFNGTDACVAPVLTMAEAPNHPHLAARQVLVDDGSGTAPAAAPRLSRTPGRAGAVDPAADPVPVLRSWGVAESEIARWHTGGHDADEHPGP
jgi:alpha-methylacyl-CoA racemase